MLTSGAVMIVVGAIAGEFGNVDPGGFSTKSLAGFVWLVTAGSLVAYTAYVWLLKNAPISKVATYAYVNPVVALLLGWLILAEHIGLSSLIGAVVIVLSVAFVVMRESTDVGAGEGNVAPPGAGQPAERPAERVRAGEG